MRSFKRQIFFTELPSSRSFKRQIFLTELANPRSFKKQIFSTEILEALNLRCEDWGRCDNQRHKMLQVRSFYALTLPHIFLFFYKKNNKIYFFIFLKKKINLKKPESQGSLAIRKGGTSGMGEKNRKKKLLRVTLWAVYASWLLTTMLNHFITTIGDPLSTSLHKA